MTDVHRLRELAKAAKVLGLSTDPSIPIETRLRVAAADQDKRQLTAQDLHVICSTSGMNLSLVTELQSQASMLVEKAKTFLACQRPWLLKPGGALHPSHRAEACWRDCLNFFRVILYALACGQPQFTDPNGMAALRELYHHMGVPTDGLNIALEQLKQLTEQEICDETSREVVLAAFDHLILELNKSAVKS